MSCGVCGKAKGLAQAVGTWVGSGMPVTPSQDAEHRMTLCRACNRFKEPLCTICGCLMTVKTKMATAKCPEGRW